MSGPEHTPLCHCGSCEDAVEAAFRTMEQMLEHQCIHWFVAVTILQAKVVQSIVDSDPEAAIRALRFQDHLHENHESYGDRLVAIIERGGLYGERVN